MQHPVDARRSAARSDTIGRMAAATQHAPDDSPRDAGGRPVLRIVVALLVAGALLGGAIALVGPAPRSADESFPDSPPPLALPSDVDADAPVARAAAKLAAGQLDAANAGFVDVVADDQDDVVGQVGLVLTRWRSTGPRSVERDLQQLTREYPESAFAALHLGMVQTVLRDQREARATLRSAVELGRDAGDPTSLRMASLADDLLHPDGFRGALPVLVAADEVAPAVRPQLRALQDAVAAQDRSAVARAAARLEAGSDPMARIAAVAGSFDKDEPDATVDRLEELAGSPALEPAERDRARLLATLARLWRGDGRSDGCSRLAASTTAATDAATRRLATPIRGELCSA
ncbi:MAG: hypothetical protein JWM86_1706 [Thermoleophilia bacterium]|nr:hypothetical protein [Thermoleophilia bacterium]